MDGSPPHSPRAVEVAQAAYTHRWRLKRIPEDIDCHKPSSWLRDALFQPKPRDRYRAMLKLGYTDSFRLLHPDEAGQFTFWITFAEVRDSYRAARCLLSAASFSILRMYPQMYPHGGDA
jgi:hypothetical protein